MTTAPAPFFAPGDDAHPAYASLRDRDWLREERENLELMWKLYQPVCGDSDFLSMARRQFPSASWQMYLAVLLMRSGFEVMPTGSAGPDILLNVNGQRVWVEATAVTSGDGPDRVPGRDERGTRNGNTWTGGMPRDDSLILRCTNAVRTKVKQHRKHREAGIVKDDDAVVLALNLGAIPDADIAEPLMPIAFKALLPVGEFGWEVEIGLDKPPKTGFTNRPVVKKGSGAEVRTDFFLNPDSNVFSGLITSERMVFQHQHDGADLSFLHHPAPRVPLPEADWPWRTEWRADGGTLRQVAGEPYFSG